MVTPLGAKQTRRHLRNLTTQLNQLAHHLPAIIDKLTASQPDGYTSGQPTKRHNHNTSDPTAHIALHTLNTTLTSITNDINTLQTILNRLTSWTAKHQTTPNHNHHQCTGGPTNLEWSNPDCTNYVDYYIRKDGTITERGDQLCTTCRQRRTRWNQQHPP